MVLKRKEFLRERDDLLYDRVDRYTDWLSAYYGRFRHEIFDLTIQNVQLAGHREEICGVLGIDEIEYQHNSVIFSCPEFDIVKVYRGTDWNFTGVDAFFRVDDLVYIQMLLEV